MPKSIHIPLNEEPDGMKSLKNNEEKLWFGFPSANT